VGTCALSALGVCDAERAALREPARALERERRLRRAQVPLRAFLPSQVLNCALALHALPRACAAWAAAGGGPPPPARGGGALLGAAGALAGVGLPTLAVHCLERRARRIFLASLSE